MYKAFLAFCYGFALYSSSNSIQRNIFKLCIGKKDYLLGGKWLLRISCRIGKQYKFIEHVKNANKLSIDDKKLLIAYALRNLGLYNKAWDELRDIKATENELNQLKCNTLYNARKIEELLLFNKEVPVANLLNEKQRDFLVRYTFKHHGPSLTGQLSEILDQPAVFNELLNKYQKQENTREELSSNSNDEKTSQYVKDAEQYLTQKNPEQALKLLIKAYQEEERSQDLYNNLMKSLLECGLKKPYVQDINKMVDDGFLDLFSKDAYYLLVNCRGFHELYNGVNTTDDTGAFCELVIHAGNLPIRIYKLFLKQLIEPLTDSLQSLPFNNISFDILSNHLAGMHKWDCLQVRWYVQKGEMDKIDEYLSQFESHKQQKIYLYIAKYCNDNKLYQLALRFAEKANEIESNNVIVWRRLIGSYHLLGNITKRLEYIKKLRKRAPERLFNLEYEMAHDEFLLQKQEWNWSRKRKEVLQGDAIVHVLNKSLPEVNGYTIRSNEIVEHQKKSNLYPVVVTKLGYPASQEVERRFTKEIHNEIEHYRLYGDNRKILNKVPMSQYFTAYADEFGYLMREIQPKLIHAASNFQNALPALKVAEKYNIPSVYEVRGLWHDTQCTKIEGFENSERYLLHEKYELICCHTADRVVAISKSLKDHLIKLGVPESKIYFVPNGVDVKKFTPQKPNEEILKKYDLENKLVIGFIGSVTHYEGLDYLLKALAKLKKVKNEIKFLLVGDGKALLDLKNLANELDLQDVVIFVGRVPHNEVKDYYSVVDVFPFPRTSAKVCQLVTPLKPYEAMAMEKLVMVSDIPALREMVIEGETGLVFKSEDVDSLVQCLLQVENNQHLAKQGRDWVVKNRAWDLLVERYDEVYNF